MRPAAAAALLLVCTLHGSGGAAAEGNGTDTPAKRGDGPPPGAALDIGSGVPWPPVKPDADCRKQGLYFDLVVQRCLECSDVDPNAVLIPDVGSASTRLGAAGQCRCASGFVQCGAGEWCTAGDTTFQAKGVFECRACPSSAAGPTAPTEDRRRCLPCLVEEGAENATLGFSEEANDCLCPAGRALLERGEDGQYLPAKVCVRCAEGMAPGPSEKPSAAYRCGPCPDPERMEREPSTGLCVCRTKSADGLNYVDEGGMCIAAADFNLVNDRFSISAAKMVVYRDLIDNRESWFEVGPFGRYLGIHVAGDSTLDALRLDDPTRVDTPTVSSSTVELLYMQCATGCLNGNATACECISNLCVLLLYDDTAVVCRFLTNFLYEGKAIVNYASRGMGNGFQGMPWLYYTGQMAMQIVNDASLMYKFTLSNEPGARTDTTNMLTFWLGRYSVDGKWLGWERLGDQLDLCTRLGGTSLEPQSPAYAWRRFASSLMTACTVPLANILKCGREPVLYDMFIQDMDGSLLPVPVRILNLIQDSSRPNLNFDRSVWRHQRDDVADDVLVRRFSLCDSVTGRAGGVATLDDPTRLPIVFRWAAHMAIEISVRPGTDGQIYIPVLSIAYAEKKAANLGDTDLAYVSFKAEYSMGMKTYWTVMVVFLCLICMLILALASIRMYLAHRRFPNIPITVPGGDLSLFVPKLLIQVLVLLSTGLSVMFWFHWTMAMYWLIVFKAQDAPFLLLPSAFQGNHYEPHDALMVFALTLSIVCLSLDFLRHMKVFIFFIDWERGEPMKMPASAVGYAGRTSLSPRTQLEQMHGGLGQQMSVPGASLLGANQMQFGYDSMGPAGSAVQPGAFADAGVSAWRTIFIANQLHERLASTRTVPHVTWLGMVALLEGLKWKNAARWYPRFAGNEDMLSAQFNPFIQFALGTSVWLAIIFLQLLARRVASIVLGNEHHDFVDACSVANVSVFIMDEPFHGYYIHGKSPGGRGDLCHSEIANQLHKEDKGIVMPRGLTLDDCQTFELYLPPDLSVQVSGSTPAHFRQKLCEIFGGVNATALTMANRRPNKPEPQDIAEMSQHRCRAQALLDALVHAVMRRSTDVVQPDSAAHWFWGTLPQGGVAALRQPAFWRDNVGFAWASCLAYGAEIRVLGLGFPSGFEWHLLLVELFCFHMCWRFQDSVYLGAAVAFLVNQGILGLYAFVGRWRLAHTSLISSMFFVGSQPRSQGLVYGVILLAYVIHKIAEAAGD